MTATAPDFKPNFIGVGSYGFVHSLNELIVVKVSRGNRGSAEDFAQEQNAVKTLGRRSPYLLPYLYLVPHATFMLRCKTDLRFLIGSKSYRYDAELGARWMGQICGGAAYLESQRMAHGDLRPDNVLMDYNGNLRLSDFGNTLTVGERLPTGTEPFARQLSKEDGKHADSYGCAGPYTENFALGSIYYSITRGYYPHQLEELSASKLTAVYKAKQFSPLTNSMEDKIIDRCWWGHYQSVAELEQVFVNIGDRTEWFCFEIESEDLIQACRADCSAWFKADGLARLCKPGK